VLRPLYDYAWFVGFAVSFATYLIVSNPLSLKRPSATPIATDR
jgi:cytosine/uracil/thiamine/allantoin permease